MAKLLERKWTKGRRPRKGKKIMRFKLRETETDRQTRGSEDLWQMLEIRNQL